jgi:hypothetical protein
MRNNYAFEEFAFTIDFVELRLKFKLIAIQVTVTIHSKIQIGY